MPNGLVIKGGQGNFPFEQAAEFSARSNFTIERIRGFERSFFAAPWIKPDPQAELDRTPLDQIAAWHAAIPPGVIARQGTSVLSPAQIPDLIGVKERKYLDHTGLLIQRSIADMMRTRRSIRGPTIWPATAGSFPRPETSVPCPTRRRSDAIATSNSMRWRYTSMRSSPRPIRTVSTLRRRADRRFFASRGVPHAIRRALHQ